MKLIVWKIVGENNSHFSNNRYIRYALKGLDDNKNYYLNLPFSHNSFVYLKDKLREGNIIEASLQTNNKNVNYFHVITIIKEVNNGKSN